MISDDFQRQVPVLCECGDCIPANKDLAKVRIFGPNIGPKTDIDGPISIFVYKIYQVFPTPYGLKKYEVCIP